jgi:hypothetical protein
MISRIECGDPNCLMCVPRWLGPMPDFRSEMPLLVDGLDQLPDGRMTIMAGSVSEELEELEIDARIARDRLAEIVDLRADTVSLDDAIAELGMKREDLGVD